MHLTDENATPRTQCSRALRRLWANDGHSLALPLSPLSGPAAPVPCPALGPRSPGPPQPAALLPPRALRGPVPTLAPHSVGAVTPRADLRTHEGEVADVWGLWAAPFNASSGDGAPLSSSENPPERNSALRLVSHNSVAQRQASRFRVLSAVADGTAADRRPGGGQARPAGGVWPQRSSVTKGIHASHRETVKLKNTEKIATRKPASSYRAGFPSPHAAVRATCLCSVVFCSLFQKSSATKIIKCCIKILNRFVICFKKV